MKKKLETPVLFLVFNRPNLTQRVFDVIKKVKPTKLYVSIDAPRKNVPTDVKLVEKVKQIVEDVDWPCETKYLIHEDNQGCTLAGKTAWDWFFKHEDEMIFLEDDGLVSESFFWFCEELLKKYRNDSRIAYIGGVNYGMQYGDNSYFFSRLPSATYSMATWKRVYNLYEYKLESYSEVRDKEHFTNNFNSRFEYLVFREQFDIYVKDGGNTYDIQMNYLSYKYNMFSIYPNINLSSNIGLDNDGANNQFKSQDKIVRLYGNRPRFEIVKIDHPDNFFVDKIFEKRFFIKRVFRFRERYFLNAFRMYLPKSYKVLRSIYRKFEKK